ncbi:MAG: M48 family metalloprotease [Thermaerobacter sp.]|nr:M48 family metalloprotease [Thermaerobacter sp.]
MAREGGGSIVPGGLLMFVLLTGAGLTVAYAVGLRHVLWAAMPGHMHSPALLFWAIQAEGALMALFWVRAVRAVARRLSGRIRLTRRLLPMLQPMARHELPPGLSSAIRWYMAPDLDPYAFSWGWREPRVVVSRGLWEALTNDERTAVLFHEQHHITARDPLWQEILSAMVEAYPLPGARTLYRRYLRDREIRADMAAVAAMDGERAPLAAAMLAVAGIPNIPLAAVAEWAGALEARIDYLVSGRAPRSPMNGWMSVAAPSLLPTVLAIGQGLLLWCR